jgi:hypothetical protein
MWDGGEIEKSGRQGPLFSARRRSGFGSIISTSPSTNTFINLIVVRQVVPNVTPRLVVAVHILPYTSCRSLHRRALQRREGHPNIAQPDPPNPPPSTPRRHHQLSRRQPIPHAQCRLNESKMGRRKIEIKAIKDDRNRSV